MIVKIRNPPQSPLTAAKLDEQNLTSQNSHQVHNYPALLNINCAFPIVLVGELKRMTLFSGSKKGRSCQKGVGCNCKDGDKPKLAVVLALVLAFIFACKTSSTPTCSTTPPPTKSSSTATT